MKTTAAVVVIGLVILPLSGRAQSGAGPPPPKTTAAKVTLHATKGVVTFVDANKLVITRSPKHGKETSFVINTATERVGTVKVGSTVAVRYRTESEQKIATAVTVEHPASVTAAKAGA